MSDFLHNLRSGKFKRTDRNNRSYNEPHYRGSQRRNDGDRRKTAQHPAAGVEQITEYFKDALGEIKGVLEDIAANQRRLAEAYESTVEAHERKADAMEIIARTLKRWLPDEFEPVKDIQSGFESVPKTAVLTDNTDHTLGIGDLDHEQLVQQIISMRKEGVSYDKIAQHLESKGVPTLSGKGKWRGQTVSKLCKEM